MIDTAHKKRIVKDFEIERIVYAFDYTTINLYLNIFWWAKFRETKVGSKLHTLFDIETQISAFVHVTPVKMHDMNAMDVISYETGAYNVFDRGYFVLKRLNHITQIESYFVLRRKNCLQYEVIKNQDTNHNANGILAENELSSILRLNPFGVKPKKLFEPKYLQLLLHSVWQQLLSMIFILI